MCCEFEESPWAVVEDMADKAAMGIYDWVFFLDMEAKMGIMCLNVGVRGRAAR